MLFSTAQAEELAEDLAEEADDAIDELLDGAASGARMGWRAVGSRQAGGRRPVGGGCWRVSVKGGRWLPKLLQPTLLQPTLLQPPLLAALC